MKTMYTFLLTFFCSFSVLNAAEMPSYQFPASFGAHNISTIAHERTYPGINLTELRLSNGLTVLLKPTDFENNEIFIKLAALGGFAALPLSDRFSGEFAAEIAWESGMGGLTADQVSVLFYEHSLQFEPKIQAFSRTIEGSAGKDGLEAFLQAVHITFKQPHFTQEAWKEAHSRARESLSKLEENYSSAYEAALLKVNTQGLALIQPIRVQDLEKVNFDKAKEFFHRAFSDPSEFVCVIVGNFNLAQAKKFVSRYLGSIPKVQEHAIALSFEPPTVFPQGITQSEVQLTAIPEEALTRLTFPLQMAFDKEAMHKLAFVCQVIEARLRYVITQKMKISYGVDVSYEFPFYPLLHSPWISIRFHCDVSLVDALKQLVLTELRELQESGVNQEEIEEIKRLEASSDTFWLRDNFYWMSLLTNYYLWHWEPQYIQEGSAMVQKLSLVAVNDLLKSSFSLKNYSVVTAKP